MGYSIRFDHNCSPEQTRIKVLTDGMLVRETLADPLLSHYSVIMVDDCHERSLYTDTLLGLLKKIRRRRRDLRIVISSATLEAENLKQFFEDEEAPSQLMEGFGGAASAGRFSCNIVGIEGRMYPVEVFYLERPCKDYVQKALDTVLSLHKTQDINGDVLVFLTGQEEITRFIETFSSLVSGTLLPDTI